MIYAFKDFVPVVSKDAFVHPQATVIGRVFIEENVYVGPGAVLRGDFGGVHVMAGANIQDNCVIHMFPNKITKICANAHIGHGAVIHGAHIGPNCLVGMNAVIMDEVLMEEESIVGAMSFVPMGTSIGCRMLYAGSPAKFIKEVSPEMIKWKTDGTALYQELAQDSKVGLRVVEPQTNIKLEDWEAQSSEKEYMFWNEGREDQSDRKL